MSDFIVSASELSGSVTPPPFKSEVIRSLILAGLCGVRPEKVITKTATLGSDIRSACSAVETAFFSKDDGDIPVGESATLLRLLAPIMIAKKGGAVFKAEPSLMRRDMSALCGAIGCSIKKTTDGCIEFIGKIESGSSITIDASSSSQFASGLLICCAIVPKLCVRIENPVSQPYIALTLNCLEKFGCSLVKNSKGAYEAENAFLRVPKEFDFEYDASYAANFIVANFLQTGHISEPIHLPNDCFTNVQADTAIKKFIHSNDCSVIDSPDLFAILCISALKKECDTIIRGISRLRDKESDRVEATMELIRRLGGKIDSFCDGVIVHGCQGELNGCTIDTHGDHRIVMAAAIASIMCSGEVIILGADAVKKSAPQFFDDFIRLGGKVREFIR